MPKTTSSLPKYRRRSDGRASVVLGGREHYLGCYGSPESRHEYDRLVSEYLARGRVAINALDGGPTLDEALLAYWRFAEKHYAQPDGKPGSEVYVIRSAFRPVRSLYGAKPAAAFGPLALKVVREKFVEAGLSRSTTNKYVDRIRRGFKWMAAEEMIPASVPQALATVAGLRAGKTKAAEAPPVKPVDDAIVEATLRHLPPILATMVQLQRLSGCRPGEVCRLRPCDLDRSEDVWLYRPASHKTAYRGKDRVIYFGALCQEILAPYLFRDEGSHCFSPAETVARRRTKPEAGRRKKAKRAAGKLYTTQSYARAIARVCVRAGIEGWSPNQLRHTAATDFRSRYGIEAARNLLGHTTASTTLVYAEADQRQAIEIAREIA